MTAVYDSKCLRLLAGHHRIAIGPRLGSGEGSRIQFGEETLQFQSRHLLTAIDTAHEIVTPVQIEDVQRSGALMKPVYILRNQERYFPVRLERRQSPVNLIRFGGMKPGPATKTASPVEAPRREAAKKILIVDRLVPCPGAAGSAVVWDSRVGAAAGAAEHDDLPRDVEDREKSLRVLLRAFHYSNVTQGPGV